MFPKVLNLTGRILMGLPYLVFGIAHIIYPDDFVALQPKWMGGLLFWDYVVGLLLIACALSLMTGKLGMVGALTLSAVLLMFMIGIHIPHGLSTDPVVSKDGWEETFKALGLIGGYLGYAAYFARAKTSAATS